MRALFVRWVTAVDTLVHPEYLGLASEVNPLRRRGAVRVRVARADGTAGGRLAARALHARRPDLPTPKLYATIQVETAWGRLGPPGWQGVATELCGLPVRRRAGLSSHPLPRRFRGAETSLDYYAHP